MEPIPTFTNGSNVLESVSLVEQTGVIGNIPAVSARAPPPAKCFSFPFFLSLTADDEARGFWTSAQHVNLSAISKQFPSGAIQTV